MSNTESFEDRCSEIQQLIANGNIARAIRRLMDFVRDFERDGKLINDAILLSAQFKNLERETRLNLVDYQQAQVRQNQLLHAMLELFGRVSEPAKEEARVVQATAFTPSHHQAPVGPPADTAPVPAAASPGQVENTVPPTKKSLPAERSEPVLWAENLGKTYKSSGFSLSNINLELYAGEVTGLVGENGNGKTTLFELITGRLKHEKGQLSYPALQSGKRLRWSKVKKQIAYVTQELRPMHGSLKDNLYYAAVTHGLPARQVKREADFILHRLSLMEHVDKKWDQLSGGYKLRFTLAQALIWKPRLLVLDEPLANLDINAQLVVLNDLRDMARSTRYPMSVIVSSQHLHEVEKVSDKILFLRQGEALFNGPRHEIGADREFNTFEVITDAPQRQIEELLERLGVQAVDFDGFHYIVTAPRSVESHQVLTALGSAGLKLHYFRDLSQSTKKLFL